MPQLSELQRDQPRHVSARIPESHAVGEETYVIDERSRSSMSSALEARLVRLNEDGFEPTVAEGIELNPRVTRCCLGAS